MTIDESVFSPDGFLKVTLTAFDERLGRGELRIEELGSGRRWFYVTMKFAKGGQQRIDYKTDDVHKLELQPFRSSNLDDKVLSIEIISALA